MGGGEQVPAGGGVRPRTKLRPVESRAKLHERPDTVVIDCHEFFLLPPPEELAQFVLESVLSNEADKELFKEIKSVYADENKRQFLLQMGTNQSMNAIANLLTAGVEWPGYKNEATGRDVIIHGYSMENPVMEISISCVGWWTSEEMVRRAVSAWGEVKELKEGKLENFPNIKSDKWHVKLVKKKDVQIPGIVFHLGSERSGEEREMWKIWYKGVPKVCYHCLQGGHVMRDCKAAQVTIQTLGSQPGIGEEVEEDEAGPRQKERTFAQVLKEASYTALLLTQQEQQRKEQTAAQQKKEENAARVQAVQDKREKEKQEREEEGRKKREQQERQLAEVKAMNRQYEEEQAKLVNYQSLNLTKPKTKENMSDWSADHPDDSLWRTPLAVKENNLAAQSTSNQSDSVDEYGFSIKRNLPSPDLGPENKHHRPSRSRTPKRTEGNGHQSVSSERNPPPSL